MICSRTIVPVRAHVAGVCTVQAPRVRKFRSSRHLQHAARVSPAISILSSTDDETNANNSHDKGRDSDPDISPCPPSSDHPNSTESSPHNGVQQKKRVSSLPGLKVRLGHKPPVRLGKKPPTPEPPRGPRLGQLQRLLLLLTEFGGIYGTAAVVIAWFTNIDPFGSLHWDLNNVLFGLKVFVPLLVLDAALMLPDYSLGPEESQAVSGLIFGNPEAINTLAGVPSVSKLTNPMAETATAEITTTSSSSSSSTPATESGATNANSSSSSGSSINILLRLQMGLELLQQVYTKANPGIELSPVNEFVVVCIAALADEMLYRAVGLTLLGLWLRDRLYEAGFDESVDLSRLHSVIPQLPAELATSEFARYAGVAVIAGLGAAGFAANAIREKERIKRLQVLDKDGEASEASEALKTKLVASMGSQTVVMYGVEGVREVTASVMAGVAFLATGNLAAPLAGSVLVQTLFSTYQRLSSNRAWEKRKAMLKKMRHRSNKLQAAMEAALAAKKAEAAAAAAEQATAAATAAAVASVDAVASDVSSPSGAEQQQHQQQQDGNVDFLTAVLLEAERQQQQQQTAAAAAASSSGRSEALSSVADWTDSSSSSHVDAASSSSSSTRSDPASAHQPLSALLEDMLRSPEGSKVVQRWMDGQPSNLARPSNPIGSSSSRPKDLDKAVELLLANPETKARLMKELEEQLCAIAEVKQRRAKQEETWRR